VRIPCTIHTNGPFPLPSLSPSNPPLLYQTLPTPHHTHPQTFPPRLRTRQRHQSHQSEAVPRPSALRQRTRRDTCVGWVTTRCPGVGACNRVVRITARYAIVPVQNGLTEAMSSAASFRRPSPRAHCAFSSKSVRLTADFNPSAPIRRLQVAAEPSSN
jgi:hypothetical protein